MTLFIDKDRVWYRLSRSGNTYEWVSLDDNQSYRGPFYSRKEAIEWAQERGSVYEE